MRKVLALFAFLSLGANLLAQNNYEVDFYIHEDENDTIYLTSFRGGINEISDSALRQKDGSFHFSLVDYPQGMYMLKDSQKRDMFSFLLDKSNKFSIEIYNTGEAFVKGCADNDAYMLYQYENRKVQEAMYYYRLDAQKEPDKKDSLYAEVKAKMDKFEKFQDDFFATYPNNFISVVYKGMNQTVPTRFLENNRTVKKGMEAEYTYFMRKHYWDYFDFTDMRTFYSPYFIKQFNNYITDLTNQIADSVCVAIDDFVQIADQRKGREYADYIIGWYLSNMPRMPFSYNEIVYIHMVNKYLDRAARYLLPSDVEIHKQYANKISRFLPGKLMPNLVLPDFEGKTHKLYSLTNKFTVVYFFSSTCESCKKNIEVLKDLYATNKEYYDVEIFAVDLDEDYAMAKARQQAEPFPWIVTYSEVENLRPYGFILDHTPELYVLDKDKRIINKTPMYEHIEKTLDAVLKQEQQGK